MLAIERRIISEITPVFAQPVMDVSKAACARDIAHEITKQLGCNTLHHPALVEAGSLAFYNLDTRFSTPTDIQRAKNRMRRLGQAELAAKQTPLLPTIGIEIEIPLIGHNHYDYDNVFSNLGFPVNKDNQNPFVNYYEVSSSPSLSAKTQQHIINGLIRTELLPSLTTGKKPTDIRQYLSKCLISLHVNLGSPREISRNQMETLDDANVSPRLYPWMISAALGLAYTSPQRLKYRKNDDDLTLNKEFIATEQNDPRGMKIELRALEVRDQSVYELIQAAQILGMLYFSKASPEDKELAAIAKRFTKVLKTFFTKNQISDQTMQSKEVSSYCAQNPVLVNNLRNLIKRTRRAVATYQKVYNK